LSGEGYFRWFPKYVLAERAGQEKVAPSSEERPMNWGNVFVWDGSGEDLDACLEAVYKPTLRLLQAFRMRQATIGIRAQILQDLARRKARWVLSSLRDLSVLHQVELALVQDGDLPREVLEKSLREERDALREALGADAILRGLYAPAEQDPFELVDMYRALGLRWVLLKREQVLGPFVDLLDDTIYELGAPGKVYAYFPEELSSRLFLEGQVPTSRQFRDHFPTKRDRKCYLITLLREADLLGATRQTWDLLEDVYSDPSIRSWRLSTLEELFTKRKLLDSSALPRLEAAG